MVAQVKKRSGRIVPFREETIAAAITKAMAAVGLGSPAEARRLACEVTTLLDASGLRIPDVELIQDRVEEVLTRYDDRLAKAYSLYRRSRGIAREIKQFFTIHDDLKLGPNALKVLEERYLLKDDKGKIIETPTKLFERVAGAIASVEHAYGGNVEETKAQFFQAMANREFLPNSPTLMNAGTSLGQLSACFVLPIEDSLDSIFSSLHDMALIQQSGGGTGFNFSNLREKGAVVRSTCGVASGPVSFMQIYDSTTEVIRQGGKRRGANIGILDCTHPDIEEFIASKTSRRLSNFNISVAMTDAFMRKVERNETVTLRGIKNGRPLHRVSAASLFDRMVQKAWETGDPGMLFIDQINRTHPLRALGKVAATNPCGEVPLLPYESCNLGSINLTQMVSGGTVDWEKLRSTVRLAVQFLDDVIDANRYPLPQTETVTKAHRKIGLGIMGFAELLFVLRIPYGSKEAMDFGTTLIRFIQREARQKSVELGQERGSFPAFPDSVWSKRYPAMRNATCLSIAPTGTLSIIAGCSSGIEPVFAVAFQRRVMEGKILDEVSEPFKLELIRRRLYSDALIKAIEKTGSIQDTDLPQDLKDLYVTAADIDPETHVRMQAAFQRSVDNAVSKTVNLPRSATVEQVKAVFLLAWQLKCKGVTVYRYGSKAEQVLSYGTKKPLVAPLDYAGGCPTGECKP